MYRVDSNIFWKCKYQKESQISPKNYQDCVKKRFGGSVKYVTASAQ